ncbi:MAG: hypothetical protein IJ017_08090 [Oscillospiraceae bacterium]|nr:hypothetical protein [Oscillospiraceae bacterium]
MKKEDMFEALNDVDDEYIEKANGKKKRGFTKWAALAACFCIVVIGAVTIFLPNKDAAGGYDAGGSDMDGEAGMYSIAVYPPYESEENVADAQIITLSETEAYSFETLGEALPTELPEGYSYQSGYLYDTTMEDGTKYYMLRVTFADGPRPEEIVTEDGGVVAPDPNEMPDEFYVLVTNYQPVENVELYTSGDVGDIDINDIWFSNGENIYRAVEAYDLSDDEILIVLQSMD